MNQKRNVIIIAIVVLIGVCGMAGVKLYGKIKPNTAHMGLYDYFGVSERIGGDTAKLIMQDEIVDSSALIVNGENYIDYEIVKSYVSDKFYWDKTLKSMIVTTPTQVVIVKPSGVDYTENGTKKSMNNIILKVQGSKYYVSMTFIKQYANVEYKMYESPKRLVVKCRWNQDALIASTKEKAEIRFKGDTQSEILVTVDAGIKLTVLSAEESLGTKFVKVITEDGIIGYISQKSLNKSEYVTLTNNYKAPVYTRASKGTVSLGWFMVSNQAANRNYDSIMKNVSGVTAIAPTWFGFKDTTGNITSLADSSFVTKAHANNYKVWAVIDDFAKAVAGFEIYSSYSSRKNMIDQLIAKATEYKLDGINVDFEHINNESSDHYIQFIRELSVACRNHKLTLTADTYIPISYRDCYRWSDLAEVIDYLIIMGYDEYYAGSKEPGPSASLSWTQKAINNTIDEGVAKDKIVIGLPFYSRLWRIKGGNITSSDTLGMADSLATLKNAGITAAWDKETQMYYAQYNSGGEVVKIWMESESSIEAKLKKVSEAKVAGAAYWRLGYEVPATWTVIKKYIK